MSLSPVKSIIACAGFLGLGAVFITSDNSDKVSASDMLAGLTGNTSSSDEGASPVVKVASAPPKVRQSASVVSIPRHQGQFFTQGRVNHGSVRFLVDTGASAVALTLDDAKRAGLDPGKLRYTVPVSTANGIGYAAAVELDEVRVASAGSVFVRSRDWWSKRACISPYLA